MSIDRRTLLTAAVAVGVLPARLARARHAGEVFDMTSTYPHYRAAIGFGRAACDAPEVGAADLQFAS